MQISAGEFLTFFGIFASAIAVITSAIITSRAQVRIKQLEIQANDLQAAHTVLNAKVATDAEVYAAQREADLRERDQSAHLVEQWQQNYSGAISLVAEVNTKYGLLIKDYDGTKKSLDGVTMLSERQKEQIGSLQTQQEKNVSSLKTAGETIAGLTMARDSDHRMFEDTIGRANDEHDARQKELQGQISKLTEDVKIANEKIDKLTRQVAEVESSNQNMGFEIDRLRREVDHVKSERDDAIRLRDQYKRELDELRNPIPPPEVESAIALVT